MVGLKRVGKLECADADREVHCFLDQQLLELRRTGRGALCGGRAVL
jgi:hypothetical protein